MYLKLSTFLWENCEYCDFIFSHAKIICIYSYLFYLLILVAKILVDAMVFNQYNANFMGIGIGIVN